MDGRELLRRLASNWELKLLALLAAAALWLLVVTGEKAEVTLPVAVEFYSIPAGLEVVSARPNRVDVLVQGLGSTLRRLTGEELRAEVSLAGAARGESALRLLPEHVRGPRGVTVLRVSPSRVRVVLGPSGRRRAKDPGPPGAAAGPAPGGTEGR